MSAALLRRPWILLYRVASAQLLALAATPPVAVALSAVLQHHPWRAKSCLAMTLLLAGGLRRRPRQQRGRTALSEDVCPSDHRRLSYLDFCRLCSLQSGSDVEFSSCKSRTSDSKIRIGSMRQKVAVDTETCMMQKKPSTLNKSAQADTLVLWRRPR